MKRFQFNLEKVLRVRTHETTVAKQNLAAALLQADGRRKALQRAESALRRSEAEWAEQAGRGRKTVLQWNQYNLLHEALVEAREGAVRDLEEAEALVARRRQDLAEARRREKVLETLKERQWEAYQQEALMAEQKETDEIAQNVRRVWKEAAMR